MSEKLRQKLDWNLHKNIFMWKTNFLDNNNVSTDQRNFLFNDLHLALCTRFANLNNYYPVILE